MEGSPPLHLVYDAKKSDETSKTAELENNQLYINLDSKSGDTFHFCFRSANALSTKHYSSHYPSPPVITRTSTGQSLPDIQVGEVRRAELTADPDRWQYEHLAKWRLPAGKASLVLSVQDNNNEWSIEPECSGIVSESTGFPPSSDGDTAGSHSYGDKKRSSVDIVFRNPKASENKLSNPGDTSRSNAPFAIPANPNIADNSESYTSSGGGFGGSDDLDDPFKRRPGGGMAPLYSFEVMSKLVSRIILVPIPGANEGTVKKKQAWKQVWDTQIVLKIKRGWNEQTILISQQLWDKIRRANLERNSGLFLAMSQNPDNPEAAFDHYLNSNPEQTENYHGYTKQAFILSPKQLLSVSVFPGSCPTGVSCPKGEGTEKITKGVSGLDLTDPPSYAESQAAAYRRTSGGSGSGNEGGDGFDGTPKNGACQKCKQFKHIYRNDMCFECANNAMRVFEQSLSDPAPVLTTKKIPVTVAKVVDTSAIKLSRWLEKLVDTGQDGRYFQHIIQCKRYELYRVLTETLLQYKESMKTFHKYWVKLSRNELSTAELILKVGELASNNGINRHAEVARIIKTLARHREHLETKYHFDRVKENKLADILKESNLVTANDLYNLEYRLIGHQNKKELIDFIYQILQQTSHLLTDATVPSTSYTLMELSELSRELGKDYLFGLPIYKDGNLDISPWGWDQYSFITQSNRYRVETNTKLHTLESFGHFISEGNPSTPEQVKAILTGLAILSSTLPETGGFRQKLSTEQRVLFSKFAETARKELVNFLNLTTPDQKYAFINSMFFIFGVVPTELADQLTQEQEPGFIPQEQAAAGAVAHRPHKQSQQSKISSPRIHMDSPLPDDVLRYLADELSTNWKWFAWNTGILEYYQVETIDAENHRVQHKAMKMLDMLKHKRGGLTFGYVLNVLRKIKLNLIGDKIAGDYGLPITR